MSRPARAALVAVMVAATFALAPAAAAERATLKVTARVVSRCTVEVPPWIASSEWRRWRHRPRHFVRHRCRGRPPFWVHAKKVWFRYARDRAQSSRHGQEQRTRHPFREDVVLVTITY